MENLSDVIIVGGGPAGVMAAISVKTKYPQAKVTILDQSAEICRKLLVSGAGRANLTNINLSDHPEKYYHNSEFVSGIFKKFGYQEITEFFQDLGIPLYEEIKSGRGKIFPVINHAKTVRERLLDELTNFGVQIITNEKIKAAVYQSNSWLVQGEKNSYQSVNLVISTGGKTYPSLGSDGSGYDLVKSFGHTTIDPVPSAVPLVSKNQLSHYLQGETARMKVESYINGKLADVATGEVMFTQYGFSGPAIFDVSRNISIRINREKILDTQIKLSFFPDSSTEVVESEVFARFKKYPQSLVARTLYGLLTVKVAGAVCAVSEIPKDRIIGELTQIEKVRLIQTLTSYQAEIYQTRGWNEAEFTSGGIAVSEVNPETLESKIQPHLFFAGEILDVDGMVGGFNLSWAWASGWVAGQSVSV